MLFIHTGFVKTRQNSQNLHNTKRAAKIRRLFYRNDCSRFIPLPSCKFCKFCLLKLWTEVKVVARGCFEGAFHSHRFCQDQTGFKEFTGTKRAAKKGDYFTLLTTEDSSLFPILLFCLLKLWTKVKVVARGSLEESPWVYTRGIYVSPGPKDQSLLAGQFRSV